MKPTWKVQSLTKWIESHMIILLVTGLVTGFFLDQLFSPLEPLIGHILVVNMLTLALGCKISQFAVVIRSPWMILCTVLFIYGLIPLGALGIGHVFFPNTPELIAGLVLIAVLPVAVTSAVWTDLSQGNLPFTLSIITLTTLLAGIITPGAMTIVAGTLIEFDAGSLILKLFKTVIIPVIVGLSIQHLLPRFAHSVRPRLNLLVKLNIILTLAINAAVMKPYLEDIGITVIAIISAVFLLVVFSYLLGYCFGSIAFRNDRKTRISVAYVCGMRNNGAGLVIASAYFPPLVALPVIMSILIQQPLATFIQKFTVQKNKKLQKIEYVHP